IDRSSGVLEKAISWFLLVSWSVTIRILVSGKGLPFSIRGRLDPMSRPMFRSTALLFLSCLGVALAPALARAQATLPGGGLGNIATDPFTFYYAYYLPNQQIQAMRPTPMDTINQAVIDRQYYAQTQKQSLYNPISPYAEDYDPLRPYSRQQGNERIARPFRFAQNSSNSNGSGPALYYNRAAQYFQGLRTGRGPNANVAPTRAGRYGGMGRGMGGGMGGTGMGMPGMGGMG